MKELYQIGEFAKRLGTSKEFLSYYDKEDLVKPFWKDERGYRYYAPAQWVHVLEYFNLQKIGFSQADSRELLEHAGLEEWIAQFRQQQENLSLQIASLQEYCREAAQMQEALERIRKNQPFTIERLENCVFRTEKMVLSDKPYTNWKHHPQLMHFWQYVKLSSPEEQQLVSGKYKRIWGSLTPMTQPDMPDATDIPVTAGNCFCYYHRIKAIYDSSGTFLTDDVWDFNEPLRIMKEHQLRHGTDLFQQRLSVTHEEDGDYVQVKTMIPLL